MLNHDRCHHHRCDLRHCRTIVVAVIVVNYHCELKLSRRHLRRHRRHRRRRHRHRRHLRRHRRRHEIVFVE